MKRACDKGHAVIETDRRCKICAAMAHADFRKNNPEYMCKSRIESQMKCRYGINSIAERDAILVAQGGACKLCRRTDCHWGKGFQDVWHIDHVHGTKIVRGILCAACNMLVGQIEKNLTLSQEAIKYLQRAD